MLSRMTCCLQIAREALQISLSFYFHQHKLLECRRCRRSYPDFLEVAFPHWCTYIWGSTDAYYFNSHSFSSNLVFNLAFISSILLGRFSSFVVLSYHLDICSNSPSCSMEITLGRTIFPPWA